MTMSTTMAMMIMTTITIMMRLPPGSYWGVGSVGLSMAAIVAPVLRDTVRRTGSETKKNAGAGAGVLAV